MSCDRWSGACGTPRASPSGDHAAARMSPFRAASVHPRSRCRRRRPCVLADVCDRRSDGCRIELDAGSGLSWLAAPVAMSIDTSRVSLPGTGLARRLSSVCSAVMQYAITWRLSGAHFGLPQKFPCSVIRFSPRHPGGRRTGRPVGDAPSGRAQMAACGRDRTRTRSTCRRATTTAGSRRRLPDVSASRAASACSSSTDVRCRHCAS